MSTSKTKTVYIQGTEYTIPAGGTFKTYQYAPTQSFSIGFYFQYYDQASTDPGKSVKLSIKNASSIGASTRYTVKSATFSTNQADNLDNTYYQVIGGGPNIEMVVESISSTRPYYNGVYENLSNSDLTISILVAMV